jgi:hypothetical protein
MPLRAGQRKTISKKENDAFAAVDVTRELVPVLVVKTYGPPRLERMLATNEWIKRQLCKARTEGSKVAVVLDVSGRRGRPTTEQQRAMAAWLRTNNELLEQACAGWAMVVTSPVLRGVLTAITWFSPFPCPMKVHATVDGGASWCIERLMIQRVPVPIELRDAVVRHARLVSARFERLPREGDEPALWRAD